MGARLTSLFKSREEVRILMVGLENSGKTSLLNMLRYKKMAFQTMVVPTIGFIVEPIKYKNTQLAIWDIGGRVRSLWPHYFPGVQAIIFVVDATDPEKFSEAREALFSVLTHPDLEAIPLLILVNKQDEANAFGISEVESALNFAEITGRTKCISRTSALKREGLKETLEWLKNNAMRDGFLGEIDVA